MLAGKDSRERRLRTTAVGPRSCKSWIMRAKDTRNLKGLKTELGDHEMFQSEYSEALHSTLHLRKSETKIDPHRASTIHQLICPVASWMLAPLPG